MRWTSTRNTAFTAAFETFSPPADSYSGILLLGLIPVLSRQSFTDGPGKVRTYLEVGEILECFRGHEVIHHWEGTGPLHRHGDGPPERHELFEAVLRRS